MKGIILLKVYSVCKRWNRLTSIIFLLVSDSWGSLYSVYLRRTLSMSVLAYWYSLLLELKIINAISQSHKTDNSYAFFITPNFLLLNVTWSRERRFSVKYSFIIYILGWSVKMTFSNVLSIIPSFCCKCKKWDTYFFHLFLNNINLQRFWFTAFYCCFLCKISCRIQKWSPMLRK